MKKLIASIFRRLPPDSIKAASPNVSPDSEERFAELIRAGQTLEDSGNVRLALRKYQQALEINERSASVHINLGNAHSLLNMPAAALDSFRRASEIDPASSSAHFNLGNTLLGLKKPDEAAEAYRRAVKLKPDWPQPQVGLACALEETGDLEGAIAIYLAVLESSPDHVGAAYNVSGLLLKTGRGGEARGVVDRCLALNENNLSLAQRQAEICWESGSFEDSLAILRRMIEVEPLRWPLQSNYLWDLNFLPHISAEDLLLAHLEFGRLIESVTEISQPIRERSESRSRPLRIAYLSPDLCSHPVANFIVPLLRHHDPEIVEVICYSIGNTDDQITALIRSLSPLWRDAGRWSDEELKKSLLDDRIDILIDLAGHTAGNRIAVLASKPAAVQITWLGYLGTTGLSRMDYRICDEKTDPREIAEHWQTEKPLRMPHSQWCFEPLVQLPPPSPLPRLKHGYWTFGSFNNGHKLNSQVLQSWADMLRSHESSRIRLYGLKSKENEKWVIRTLTGCGIEKHRITAMERMPVLDYYCSFSEVDVALDTFPYNGATTTCDALIMGLPVLGVKGARSLSRGAFSLLSSMGMQDWVADSPAGLSALTVKLLGDPQKISELRSQLPDRFRNSPLMDATLFTRDFESLLLKVWSESRP